MPAHPLVDAVPAGFQPILPELSMTFHTPSALLAAEKVALSEVDITPPQAKDIRFSLVSGPAQAWASCQRPAGG